MPDDPTQAHVVSFQALEEKQERTEPAPFDFVWIRRTFSKS